MADPSTAIPAVRERVAAILRIRMTRPETVEKGKVLPAQFQAALGGSAFQRCRGPLPGHRPSCPQRWAACKPADKFYAFMVPGNGNPASLPSHSLPC